MSGLIRKCTARFGTQEIQFVLKAVDLTFQFVEGQAIRSQVKDRLLVLWRARNRDGDARGPRCRCRLNLESERADLAHDPDLFAGSS